MMTMTMIIASQVSGYLADIKNGDNDNDNSKVNNN